MDDLDLAVELDAPDDGGQDHFTIAGSVANRHLVDRSSA